MTHTRTPTAPELTGAGARWFKSSHSDGAGNNCSDAASSRPDTPVALLELPRRATTDRGERHLQRTAEGQG